jgi:hypothetical protein
VTKGPAPAANSITDTIKMVRAGIADGAKDYLLVKISPDLFNRVDIGPRAWYKKD